jgi:transcription-repair coupling factor (superfamily II helicase)
MEHWMGFFHERLETIFDYLPQASVMIDDQIEPQRISRWEGIVDQYDTRREALTRKDRVDTVYKPAAPDLLYLDEAGWKAALMAQRVLRLQVLPAPPGPGILNAEARIGRNFAPERQLENVSLFGALKDHIQARLKLGPVVVASWSEGARERLKGLLEDEGLTGAQPIRDAREIGGLGLAIWALDHGFEADGLTVISERKA